MVAAEAATCAPSIFHVIGTDLNFPVVALVFIITAIFSGAGCQLSTAVRVSKEWMSEKDKSAG